MKVVIALLLCVVVCAFAQTPQKPIWPNGWSATVRVHRSDDRDPAFYRWFYDKGLNKDRIDGVAKWKDEYYIAERIFDHQAGRQYDVFYQAGSVNCFDRAINNTLPKPDFSRFTYIGKALVNYEPAYHWIYEDKLRGLVFAVYDRQDNRQILRIDLDDAPRRRSESWLFLEYDVGPQSAELFTLEKIILDQCNDF